MSTSGEDDSRPSRPPISPRPTMRDVPTAKYAEPSSAPRGLRGQSLLPGQGAPERIVPEDIELAVLREADTLDGSHLARAGARRVPDLSSSPPPTPVSVEVPRVRSAPPSNEPDTTTPLTPSARSVQSGTLMSIGSVDPRAPTELSLPSPRVLSQAERAAYLGPEAVVDRTPVSALASPPRELRAPGAELAEPLGPPSEPLPHSSARSVAVGSGEPPASSARRSQKADSPAPAARSFDRGPSSYSPVSVSPAAWPRSPAQRSQPPSVEEGAPRFEIHSELDAVPHELFDDNFDLRSASTQREPLASRKPMVSTDGSTVHAPVSSRRDSAVPSARAPSRTPSSSAMTIGVDPERHPSAPLRDSLPNVPAAPPRASVPLSWVLGAAAFALVLALLVAWVARAPARQEAARPAGEQGQPERRAALATALPSLQAALPSTQGPADSAANLLGTPVGAVNDSRLAPKHLPVVSAPHVPETAPVSVPSVRPAATAAAHAADLPAAAGSSTEPSTKPRQSIY